MGLAPHTSGGILARIIGYTSVRGCYAHPYFHAAKRRNCDGDEDCIMLLMDGLLNFSESFLSAGRGGRMDAPLVLSIIINPSEIDDEAHNVDTLAEYPLKLYRAAEKGLHFQSVDEKMGLVKSLLGKETQYEGFGFTHDTPDINSGPKTTKYTTIKKMELKAEAQLNLAKKIDAVDPNDVATRVIRSHLLPDIRGNLRKYSQQTVRCTRCNRKFRRVPLSGKCKCGNNLILTIHRGGVEKYRKLAKKLAMEQEIDPYVESILLDLDRSIERTFARELPSEEVVEEEKGKNMTLMEFF